MMLEVVGLDKLERKLRDLGPRGRLTVKQVLVRFAERIMTRAKQEFVPVFMNALRSSGVVKPLVETGNEVSVTMAFGGASVDYALAVHEHLSEHSPRSWKLAEAAGRMVHFRVGGPKYLERPFDAEVQGGKLERALADAVTEAWDASA